MTTDTIKNTPATAGDPQLIRRVYTFYGATLALTTLCAVLSWLAGVNRALGATLTAAAVLAALYIMVRHQAARVWSVLLAYAGLIGLALGSAFMRQAIDPNDYGSVLIAGGMTLSAAIVLPGYIRKTKTDLSHIQGYLLISLLALVVAGAVLHDPLFLLAVSVATTLVFAGFILYDASRLEHGRELNPVLLALNMHINVIALFWQVLSPH